jgi:glycolate oxidase FAD binding subunit
LFPRISYFIEPLANDMSASAGILSVLRPSSLEQVQRHVLEAAASGEALEVRGGGSKRFYGRPVRAARALSLAALAGVVDYQPHELILVARPGTPLAALERTLAGAGQMLAFEPPHWGEGATLGGAIACNLSGPRRFKAGAARDHLLGFQAVTGKGEVVRGGGKVVKNVTGYDLPKLMCGSFGTLAVFTELVVKVLPRPETEGSVVFCGLSDGAGLERLVAVSRSSHEASGLAHLPGGLALPGALAGLGGNGGGLSAVRVEGPAPSVRARSEALAALGGQAELLGADDSRVLWQALREVSPLAPETGERLWRFSVPPTAGTRLGEALRGQGAGRLCYDWGGGLVWAVLPARVRPATAHALARSAGGHARIVRSGEGVKAEEPVFSELTPGQYRLNVNLKLAFDPQRILNPGRIYPEL